MRRDAVKIPFQKVPTSRRWVLEVGTTALFRLRDHQLGQQTAQLCDFAAQGCVFYSFLPTQPIDLRREVSRRRRSVSVGPAAGGTP